LIHKYPSDIELYYSTEISNNKIELIDVEFKHAVKVMRHKVGDVLRITDGAGKYYITNIVEISENNLIAEINSVTEFQNKFKNIWFCFPRLKSNDRFEFELEKAIELGITNFLIINTNRTIPKGAKLERWNKIAYAAMKQSLRMHLPRLEYLKSIEEINNFDGVKIILDQNGDENLQKFLAHNTREINDKPIYFIFGPEGGLTSEELNKLAGNVVSLTENRLRAETAVITAAVLLNTIK